MSSVNLTGAKNLRKIRVDLGLAQRELECENAQNISQLETGGKAITEDVSAPALVQKIKQVMKEKGLSLPYEVTIDLLLGKFNIITDDILKKLKAAKTITTDIIFDIDINIKELSNDDSIEFINQVIDILNEDSCKNAELMRKYALKLLKLDLDFDNRIQANRTLIKAYSWLRKYDDVIATAENIEDDIEKCKDKEAKISLYTNIAVAYYQEKRYDESLQYLRKLKVIDKNNEFFYLSLESAILAMKGDLKRAEKSCFNLLNIAKNKVNNDYVVESYSKLSDVYNKMNLKDKAKEYVDYALESINCGTLRVHRFNAYFNAYEIYNELNEDRNKIEELFLKAYPLAIELNYINKLELLFENAFDRYFEERKYNDIANILKQAKGLKIKSEILEKVMERMAESL